MDYPGDLIKAYFNKECGQYLFYTKSGEEIICVIDSSISTSPESPPTATINIVVEVVNEVPCKK